MSEKNKYAVCTTSVARTVARRMKVKIGSKKAKQRSKWNKSEKKKYDSCLEKVDENLIRKMVIELLYEASKEDYMKRRKELVKSKFKSAKYKSTSQFPAYLIEQFKKGNKEFDFKFAEVFPADYSNFYKKLEKEFPDVLHYVWPNRTTSSEENKEYQIVEKTQKLYEYRIKELILNDFSLAAQGKKVGDYDFLELISAIEKNKFTNSTNAMLKRIYENREKQAPILFLKKYPNLKEDLILLRKASEASAKPDTPPERQNELVDIIEKIKSKVANLFVDPDVAKLWIDPYVIRKINILYSELYENIVIDKIKAERRAEKFYYNTEQRKKLDKEWRVIHYIGAFVNRGTDSFTDALEFAAQTSGKKSKREMAGVAYHVDNKYLGDSLGNIKKTKAERPAVGMILDGVITGIFQYDVGSTKFQGGRSAGGFRSKSGERLGQGDAETEKDSFVRYPSDHGGMRDALNKARETGRASEYDPGTLAGRYIMDLDKYAEEVKGKDFEYNEAFIDHWSTVSIIAHWDEIKKWTLKNTELINPITLTESLQTFWDKITSKNLKILNQNFQPWSKSEWDSYANEIIEKVKPAYEKAKEKERNNLPPIDNEPPKELEKPKENPTYNYQGDLTDGKDVDLKASQIAAIMLTYTHYSYNHFIDTGLPPPGEPDDGFSGYVSMSRQTDGPEKVKKEIPLLYSWAKYLQENPDEMKIPKLPDKFYTYYDRQKKESIKLTGAEVYSRYADNPFPEDEYVKMDVGKKERWVNVAKVPQIMKFGLTDEPLWVATTISNRKPMKVRPSDILQQLKNLEKGDEMKIFLEPPPGKPINTGIWLAPDEHPVFKQHMKILNEGKRRKRKKIKVLIERKKRRRNERN